MSSAIDTEVITRSDIMNMINEKEKLEQEVLAKVEVLTSHYARMDEPLVDEQDFPRNDIDVHQIRVMRNQIIRGRNDLRAMMDRIEKSLIKYFMQERRRNRPASMGPPTSSNPEE